MPRIDLRTRVSSLPITFKNSDELVLFAENFIDKDKLDSLENDVNRCLPNPADKTEPTAYAPFPALLYCFSIIDLLGALFSGNARSGNTTENSSKFMKKYFDRTDDKLRLLQRIYRHKIVHLSQPKPAMLYNGELLAWEHNEGSTSKHLTIEHSRGDIDIFGISKIHCHGKFIVSIRTLKDDIKRSVIKSPGGYLADLRNDKELQNKFVIAINQIYDPIVTD